MHGDAHSSKHGAQCSAFTYACLALLLAEMCSRIFLKFGMWLPYGKLSLYALLSHLGVCTDTGKVEDIFRN